MNNTAQRPTRVMIVDDSAVVRRFLSDMLRARGFDVIAAVQDPLFALDFLKKDQPDVIVLDVEMPRMDGLTFLRQLMSTNPLPVVMCSTLTEKGGEITMAALAAGAVNVITKPTLGLKDFLQSDENGLVQALRSAARANMRNAGALAARGPVVPAPRLAPVAAASASVGANGSAGSMFGTTHKVVMMGLSTGGVQAIEQVLPRLPRNSPGIVIVQHMPEKFTASLADRLNTLCAIEVREARNGDRVIPGHALIAPGGKHTKLVRSGAQFTVEVFDGPVVNHHRPSVDVLFRSAAQCAGKNAVGIIMTGMGDDGARGMRDMHEAGAWTIAQDEASCVVYGMPKEAVRMGGVSETVPLQSIADRLLRSAAATDGSTA
jgi:two-component system, chemotaxis family, protein-glutamate methylesterase/glutaminase